MAGDEHGGQDASVFEVGIDGEDAFDAASLEHLRVGEEELRPVAMVDGEVEVALLHEEVAGAGDDLGVIALAEFGEEDADGLDALALKFAGDHGGLVVELASGGADALAGGGGDGAAGCVVEDEGDGGGAEVEVLGEELEAGAHGDGGLRGCVGGLCGEVRGHGRGRMRSAWVARRVRLFCHGRAGGLALWCRTRSIRAMAREYLRWHESTKERGATSWGGPEDE